ncbi:MAG: two-component system cell cycle sensor histidine kinase/response regulator CckA [Planctomycetota bacterium]|jgi:two-component system cell cycle sensor histidine kinase/response regulator CckA
MESLGVLASGIAHDLNNMLAPILGNAELAIATLPTNSLVQPMLSDIVTASYQAMGWCNQMLAYTGRSVASTEVLDCNQLVESLSSLLHVAHSKKAVLSYDLSEAPLYVEANKSQIRQVLINLIINASESIGDQAGTISVSTTSCRLDADDFKRFGFEFQSEPGEYIEIRVEDPGMGMSETTQSKMFDPFTVRSLLDEDWGWLPCRASSRVTMVPSI